MFLSQKTQKLKMKSHNEFCDVIWYMTSTCQRTTPDVRSMQEITTMPCDRCCNYQLQTSLVNSNYALLQESESMSYF